MKLQLTVVCLVAAFVAGPAVAHEKGDRAMGVVESVTTDRIVIKAIDGHAVAFAVSAETRFFIADRPARAEDVRPGQRAVVHGKRRGDGLTAVRVKLSPPPR